VAGVQVISAPTNARSSSMTKNEKIHKVIEPKKHYHQIIEGQYHGELHKCSCGFRGCRVDVSLHIYDKNPDYITMEGIGLIKAWLVKEGKWEEFKTHFIMVVHIENALPTEGITFDIATNPAAFTNKFIEYCEKEGLIKDV
jgi:hypothetical protein